MKSGNGHHSSNTQDLVPQMLHRNRDAQILGTKLVRPGRRDAGEDRPMFTLTFVDSVGNRLAPGLEWWRRGPRRPAQRVKNSTCLIGRAYGSLMPLRNGVGCFNA